jgi:hypothetical protein
MHIDEFKFTHKIIQNPNLNSLNSENKDNINNTNKWVVVIKD